MADTTIKKVDASHSPRGEMGQTYLVSGTKVALRLWEESEGEAGEEHTRPYETVGYVIEGRATLEVDGQTVRLQPGDSWLVPAGAPRKYTIESDFKAVEATAPPARNQDRDDA